MRKRDEVHWTAEAVLPMLVTPAHQRGADMRALQQVRQHSNPPPNRSSQSSAHRQQQIPFFFSTSYFQFSLI